MKSILVGPKKKEENKSEYPYLAISRMTGRVIIFTARGKGTLVHEPVDMGSGFAIFGVGHYSSTWTEEGFEPLKGKITLHN